MPLGFITWYRLTSPDWEMSGPRQAEEAGPNWRRLLVQTGGGSWTWLSEAAASGSMESTAVAEIAGPAVATSEPVQGWTVAVARL